MSKKKEKTIRKEPVADINMKSSDTEKEVRSLKKNTHKSHPLLTVGVLLFAAAMIVGVTTKDSDTKIPEEPKEELPKELPAEESGQSQTAEEEKTSKKIPFAFAWIMAAVLVYDELLRVEEALAENSQAASTRQPESGR